MKTTIKHEFSIEDIKDTITALEYFISEECTWNRADVIEEIQLAIEIIKYYTKNGTVI